MSNHYVNNEQFLNALVEHRDACKLARDNGEKEPKIPDYIGECFLMIAERLSKMPNFVGYTFREDLISDAVENCLLYYKNFDPNKSKYAFAYFTQIIYYAFCRRIYKEKKSLYMKYKMTEQLGILDEYSQLSNEDGIMKQFNVYDNIKDFINEFEEKELEKKRKKNEKSKKKGIELFFGEEE